MKEQLISYETGKLAKEKGFDIPSDTCFIIGDKKGGSSTRVWKDNDDTKHMIRNPYFKMYQNTQSLLQKWLREEKRIIVNATPTDNWDDWCYTILGEDLMSPFFMILENHGGFKSYEEALEEGLKEALKALKQ